MSYSTSPTVAVIGAGPSGLASMRNLSEAGIEFVCYEAHSSLGGIWDRSNPKSSVYRNTHTITSKGITAFSDFPMPTGYPVYPHHTGILAYLNQYADHFDLTSRIRFSQSVQSVSRAGGGGWLVTTNTGQQQWHSDVIVANGHNWHPRRPDFNGSFSGQVLHASEYEDASDFANKKVLVIGAGNSGCDIAVECCQVADRVVLSMRRGYHFYPKFIAGYPTDYVGMRIRSSKLPSWLASKVMQLLLRFSTGDQARMGLPEPDHRPLQTPAIINSLIPYYVSHGRIRIASGISAISEYTVCFDDGKQEDFDVIVLATGYKIHIPFLTDADLNLRGELPDFYLYAFSKQYNNLFIAGMTDSTGGHFPTVELQSRLISRYIQAKRFSPERARKLEHLVQSNRVDLDNGLGLIDTPRNATQFSLVAFRKTLHEHLRLVTSTT